MEKSISDANFDRLLAVSVAFAVTNDIDLHDEEAIESIFTEALYAVSAYYKREGKVLDPKTVLISDDAFMYALASLQVIYDSEMAKMRDAMRS